MAQKGSTAYLSREQEVALAYRMHKGDQKAKETLINCSMARVELWAHKISGGDSKLKEELVAEGYLKLTEKISGFNPTLGYRLATFLQLHVCWKMVHVRDKYSEERSRIVSLDALTEEEIDANLVDEIEKEELRETWEIWDLLEKILDPAEQKAMRLLSEQMSNRKIAKKLGVDRKKAKRLTDSGRKKFRLYCEVNGISREDF